jgi:hypothetical protein
MRRRGARMSAWNRVMSGPNPKCKPIPNPIARLPAVTRSSRNQSDTAQSRQSTERRLGAPNSRLPLGLSVKRIRPLGQSLSAGTSGFNAV